MCAAIFLDLIFLFYSDISALILVAEPDVYAYVGRGNSVELSLGQ